MCRQVAIALEKDKLEWEPMVRHRILGLTQKKARCVVTVSSSGIGYKGEDLCEGILIH